MLGIVVGLAAEARLAHGLGGIVEAGGGTAAGAAAAASRLVGRGANALLSFGLAGGLSPDLKAGAIVVPSSVVNQAGEVWPVDPAVAQRYGVPTGTMLAATAILSTRAEKQAAWRATGALAVDLESGAVAEAARRHGLPFAVLRAICDPASRNLPPAAQAALDQQGRVRVMMLVRSLARHPGQLGALVALGREASLARQALLMQVRAAGSTR